MAAIVVLILLVAAIFYWPMFFMVLLVLGWMANLKKGESREGCFSYLPTPPVPVSPRVPPATSSSASSLRLQSDQRVHWKYRLTEELLTKSMTEWRRRFDEILNQPRPSGGGESFYDDYAADAVRQLKLRATMLQLNFVELGRAWDSGQESQIREACAGISFGCQQLYEWTAKMRALKPYSFLMNEHVHRERMAEDVFHQVERTINILHDTIHDPDCTGTITLNANFSPPMDSRFI
jgi:hypothetical protein